MMILKFFMLALIASVHLGSLWWIMSYRDVSDVYEAYYIEDKTLEWDGDAALNYSYCDDINLGVGDEETQSDLAMLTGNWGYQNLQDWWSIETQGRWVLGAGAGILVRLAAAKQMHLSLDVTGQQDLNFTRVFLNGCPASQKFPDQASGPLQIELEISCLKAGLLNSIEFRSVKLEQDEQKLVRIKRISIESDCVTSEG